MSTDTGYHAATASTLLNAGIQAAETGDIFITTVEAMANQIAAAQVHATLAVATALADLAEIVPQVITATAESTT